jgi:hypothetical protein
LKQRRRSQTEGLWDKISLQGPGYLSDIQALYSNIYYGCTGTVQQHPFLNSTIHST